MALDNLLFGTKPLPTVTTQDRTQTSYPSWYQEFLNSLLGKASGVAAEPYKPYGQPRIAPHSADTQQAFGNVRAGIGQFQPQFQQGSSMVQGAGAGFNQGEFDTYFNPYVNQVVDRIGTLAGRNLSENLLPQVNDSFTRAGQFGSRGNFDLTGRAIRDTNESALAEQSRALASGYESQMANMNAFRDRSLTAGQSSANLAQLGQGMQLQDAAALQGIGQAQEDKTQQSLNLGYQDFQEQRDYPRQTLDWMNSIFRGYQPPTTTTSTSTGPGNVNQMAPNSLAQVAGTALGIYGLSGFKKGGRARRPQPNRPQPKKPQHKIRFDEMRMPSTGRGMSQYLKAA